MSKGFEAQSLGLVKMARHNTDPRFTAVAHKGNTIWALHPKYFNRADVKHLEDKWSENVNIDTSVYVGNIQIKGQLTHNEYNTVKKEYVPIVLGPNPFTGKSPMEYADSLGSGTDNVGSASEYAPFYLNYGVTAKSTTIDLLELEGIEKHASGNITISHPGGSISVPLPYIMAGRLNSQLRVNIVENINNGFIYEGSVGDITFSGEYKKEYRHMKVLSNYQTHMLQNRNREAEFENSQTFGSIMSIIGNITSDFNILGGANSILDALFTYGLRTAQFKDMRNQMTDLGGDLFTNLVGFEADKLITIDYPVAKYILVANYSLTNPKESLSNIKLSDFEKNKPQTYEVNGLYPDMKSALNAIRDNYSGELIGGDIKPLIDYGEYSTYFKQIIDRGGLL